MRWKYETKIKKGRKREKIMERNERGNVKGK